MYHTPFATLDLSHIASSTQKEIDFYFMHLKNNTPLPALSPNYRLHRLRRGQNNDIFLRAVHASTNQMLELRGTNDI